MIETAPYFLRIVHANDTHGELRPVLRDVSGKRILLGGSAYRAPLTAKLRKDPKFAHSIAVHVGDLQHPESRDIQRGRAIIEELNHAQCEIIVPGDHDLENGLGYFKEMVQNSGSTFLAANVKDPGKKPIDGIDPYLIKKWEITVAFIGLTNPVRNPRDEVLESMSFTEPVPALQATIREIRKFNVDCVIVLGHVSKKVQREIANEISGRRGIPTIPVIIAGHTHSTKPKGEQHGNTLIVEAGSHGTLIGTVDLKIPDKRTRKHQGCISVKRKLHPVDTRRISPDPFVKRIVQGYYSAKAFTSFGKETE